MLPLLLLICASSETHCSTLQEVEEGKVFDVVSVIMAGDGTACDTYPPNSVVKIMTGAAIPRAFNAVIMV